MKKTINETRNLENCVLATYSFRTPGRPEEAFERLALQQTTSWWRGEEQNAAGYSAQLIEFSDCRRRGKEYFGKAKVAFPTSNLEEGVAMAYNVVVGKIHFMKQFSAIKLLDLEFPYSYLRGKLGTIQGDEAARKGPRKGLGWLQEKFGTRDRPLFINPVKPGAGLSGHEFAKICYDALIGGMDIVKDDEVIVDPSYCPMQARAKEVMNAVKRAEDITGKKKGYILNISGSADQLERYYEIAQQAEVSGVMVCPGVNSIDIAAKFKDHPEIFVAGHCTMLYAQSNRPDHGIKSSVMSKLQRIAGADLLIMPFKGGDYDYLDDEEYRENFKAVAGKDEVMRKTMPSVAGGQNVRTLEESYQFIGNPNYAFVAGSFVNSHPNGTEAGAEAIRQAWEAVSQGIPLQKYAPSHKELAEALKMIS